MVLECINDTTNSQNKPTHYFYPEAYKYINTYVDDNYTTWAEVAEAIKSGGLPSSCGAVCTCSQPPIHFRISDIIKEIKYNASFEEFNSFITNKFKNIKYTEKHIESVYRAVYKVMFDGLMKSPYMRGYPDIANAANTMANLGFRPKDDKYPSFKVNNTRINSAEEFMTYIRNNSFMWNNVEILCS